MKFNLKLGARLVPPCFDSAPDTSRRRRASRWCVHSCKHTSAPSKPTYEKYVVLLGLDFCFWLCYREVWKSYTAIHFLFFFLFLSINNIRRADSNKLAKYSSCSAERTFLKRAPEKSLATFLLWMTLDHHLTITSTLKLHFSWLPRRYFAR